MASTRFVLPCPLAPMNAVGPGSRSSSALGYDRKSCRTSLATCTGLDVLRVVSGFGGSLDGMAAELLTHRGDGLHGRRLVLS